MMMMRAFTVKGFLRLSLNNPNVCCCVRVLVTPSKFVYLVENLFRPINLTAKKQQQLLSRKSSFRMYLVPSSWNNMNPLT